VLGAKFVEARERFPKTSAIPFKVLANLGKFLARHVTMESAKSSTLRPALARSKASETVFALLNRKTSSEISERNFGEGKRIE
jgi:hypothetical protein